MLKINVNRKELEVKKTLLQGIYGYKWSSVIAYLCECDPSLVRHVFGATKNDNIGILKTADYLISRGEKIPRKVESFLKTVRYGSKKQTI